MGFRRFDVLPAVQRATGNAFKNHDFAGAAGGQRRKHKVFAYTGDQVERDPRERRTWGHALDVSQCQCALWLTEQGALRVFGELIDHLTFACGQQHQIVTQRQRFQLIDANIIDHQIATPLDELVHPYRHFHALVHRLGVTVQACAPAEQLLARQLRVRHGQADALDSRALLFPEVEPQITLGLQRGVKHALAGHDLAVPNLLARTVGGQGHVVALGK
ncbi:hypothetical protein ALP75_202443 [Pseudomonas syringae pv. actinidiae]|nr:hypothetical protein ALP75_202443 [Pseudomonas syringae pv. actinidiae]